ncbi:MAG: amino acid permease [Syntrophales bacterium]|nr:amino acid permease [Syntrophales bacterium]
MALLPEKEDPEESRAPVNFLSVTDAVAIIVGIVIGAGIFKTPSVVAASSSSEAVMLGTWIAGGIISIIGAVCYAELAGAYPHAGGDYHYLMRAYGRVPAFLFAWTRMAVIQTGSIAMFSFLVGDYASEVFRLGPLSASVYAVIIVVSLTCLNICGIRQGKNMQNILTAGIITGIMAVIAAALSRVSFPFSIETAQTAPSSIGKAMIFVLLTYGGWNEASYLSSEIRNPGKSMVKVLVYSIGTVTLIYVLFNFILLRELGMHAVSASEAVGADLLRKMAGQYGAYFIGIMVIIAALSTINGTIITGARSGFALGRDFAVFGFLGKWKKGSNTPVNALLVQGGISLILVGIGTMSKSGFEMMVEYTAPVFWLFFLLVGVSLFVLRRREPFVHRPFKVPFYPLTPIIFCLFCLGMLYSSIVHTGAGALAGLAVLGAGILFMLKKSIRREAARPVPRGEEGLS